MTTMTEGANSACERSRIEIILAKYPYTEPEELADLLHWFRKRASALDVGMLASDPQLAKPYQLFKADHLDRLRGMDLIWVALFLMVVSIAVSLIVWSTF